MENGKWFLMVAQHSSKTVSERLSEFLPLLRKLTHSRLEL